MGDFIRKARHQAWFDNTLFVILGDHTAGGAGKFDLPLERYHIPLLIYAPTLLKAFGRDVLQQPDEAGRALIATYQRLGYYRPGELTILGPQHEVQQQLHPEADKPDLLIPKDNDPDLLIAQAYYQGADAVYNRHLNAWR